MILWGEEDDIDSNNVLLFEEWNVMMNIDRKFNITYIQFRFMATVDAYPIMIFTVWE